MWGRETLCIYSVKTVLKAIKIFHKSAEKFDSWCGFLRHVDFLFEGTKSKKRTIENDARAKMSPKKAKGDKKQKDDGGKKRKRKTKDTGVKRSCSAYIYFTKTFREELKTKSQKDGTPLPKANEVAKLAGEKWKKLSETERKPFDDLAAKDKARYLLEVNKFTNS